MITTKVNTDGLMSQLSEEIIESYDTGTDGKAIGDIIDDLLAFQRKATKITKGTISVIGARALQVINQTILTALLQLQESVGRYMYVDNDRKLQWATTIGEDKGQQIRYRKNLIGITRDIDYGGYCTKLHPTGSGEKLSDISRVKVVVDKDSDDDYGYLTLRETYACYKDWTVLGAALPANVKVYEGEAEYETLWTSPAYHNDPGGIWSYEPSCSPDKIYDGNTNTFALGMIPYSSYLWSDWLYLAYKSIPAAGTIWAKGYRMWLSGLVATHDYYIVVEASADGVEWAEVDSLVDSGADLNGKWVERTFAKREVWAVRMKFHTWEGGTGPDEEIKFNEFDFQEEKEISHEVTSDFHQGADERHLRCAIDKYNPGANYLVNYQFANYLMAWDKIIDTNDIVAKVVTNKYEAYAISMLEATILLLDELKEIPITYAIKAIDLSRNKDFNFDFEALQLGSILTVIDEDLGIDVPVRVVSLEHPDLLDPQNIKLELSTKVKDISDYLADLHKQFD